ncbi:TonB-dependent receptor plug domain-containing protein [Hyphobacterium sp.]|uniref:TonB-dependent receptor plug domain-containing protein n=1 Tax=Hyphobacterium sp. TaxID=2004662 RepID=UPI003BAC6C3C
MRGKFTVCAAALALTSTTSAFAQDTTLIAETANSSAVVAFETAFFTTFNPVTALDMVGRVPGFSLSDGDTERRGLADSFGNLLINGRRPSNKTIGLQTVLQRINAEDVIRIELIREPVPQYEMRGHARLVNVVLREGAGSSGSWNTRLRHFDGGRLVGDAEVAWATSRGDTDYSFGLETDLRTPRITRRESLFDAAGNQLEHRRDNEQRRYWEVELTGSIAHQFSPETRLQIDGQANTWTWNRHQYSLVDGFAGGTPRLIRFEQSQTSNSGSGGSITATLNHDLSDRLASTTTALWRQSEFSDGPEAFEEFDPGNFVEATIVSVESESSEQVLRQSFNYQVNLDHVVEFGAEAAINWRETLLDVQFNDGQTITPVPLPVANTRVEERRAEVFVNHVWTINEALNLESGLRYEFSEIEQTGDTNQSRNFAYPKPSIALTWLMTDDTTWRFVAERDVDQLDFGKFASSIDVADNNAVVGNPNYEPQRTWTLEAEAERRIGESGSVTFRIGHDWIEGVDDFISVVTPTGVFDAPGNIGDGTIFRLTGEFTLPLDSLGLDNAVLDGFIEWYDTNIFDPLTLVDRPLSNLREWELRFDYRQTFPERNLAWGWDYYWLSDGEVFRAREYRLEGFTDGDLDVYIESTHIRGITARLSVDGIIDRGNDRQRIFYNGSRATGAISAIEYQVRRSGPRFALELRGTF